jgi:predicted chitinase
LVPNIDTLSYFNLDPIRPESVKSFEISYKGMFFNKLFVDVGYYFNSYTNFIGFVNGVDVFVTPNNTLIIQDVYRIATNSKERITTQGITIGLNYYIGDHLALNGNYSWNKLNKQSEDPIIPAYNTPENKFNLGFQGKDLAIKKFKGLGFNINYEVEIPTFIVLETNYLAEKLSININYGSCYTANKVYADRLGNGNEASGDGWKLRGRGVIQLTGRDNCTAFAKSINKTLDETIVYLETKEGAIEGACWFWKTNNLNKWVDINDFDGLSDCINRGRKTPAIGDAIGYTDRKKKYDLALSLFSK